MKEVIAFDLDGTIAHYEGYDKTKGLPRIGDPIPHMIDLVRSYIANGHRVVIFTARACTTNGAADVQNWLKRNGLEGLEVTNIKLPEFHTIYDDRAIQVERNTGVIVRNKDKDSALSKQIDGSHYKDMVIQPVEFCYKNNLDTIQSNIIKYICRHKRKGRKNDILKAIHYCEMILEMDYKDE